MYLDKYPVCRNMCPSVCRSLYAVLRLADTQCAFETVLIWGRDCHICLLKWVYRPAADVGISTCIYYRAAEVGIAACIYDTTSEVVCRPIFDPAAGVGISACIRCGYRIVRPLYMT